MRKLLILVLALLSLPAFACSPRHINTARELVQFADGIYRVRAIKYFPGSYPFPLPQPGNSYSRVEFTVLGTLKGASLATIRVPGALSSRDDFNTRRAPYDFVRSEGAKGGCFAASYRLGGEYLLFIRGGTPYWAPLAATTEQLTGAKDPWLQWVKSALQQREARPNKSFKPNPLRGSA